jgi:hypothetical protein
LREQDVDVVANGINFDERRVAILEDSSDVGMKLAAFLVTEEWVAALRAENEVNDDVGEGLGHRYDALTGLGRFAWTVDLGLRSSDSLQPRLSHGGPSALPNWRAVSP